MTINWGILAGARDPGAAFQESFQVGQAQAAARHAQMQQRASQNALRVLAVDPTNQQAMTTLTANAPAEAYRFQAAQRERATFDRGQRFRDALAQFQTGAAQPNALGGTMMGGGVAPSLDALGGPPIGPEMAPRQTPSASPVVGTLADMADGGGEAGDVVVTARRPIPARNPAPPPRGPGWDEVVRADPVAAMAAEKEAWGLRESHIKDWQQVSGIAMRMLGGVRDQDTWEAGKAAARNVYEAYGVPFPDLPDDYSPQMIRDLQVQQMDFEKQVDAALAERKFEWQQQDDRIDNARDDRRVGIQDRSARDASARGWSADRRAERRFVRGDGASADDLPSDDLLRILRDN